MGWRAEDIDSSGVTLLGGDSLVCRVRPESSHSAGRGRGQIITRGRSGCLAPASASASRAWCPSHQLRLREINICAGIGQCQPGSE